MKTKRILIAIAAFGVLGLIGLGLALGFGLRDTPGGDDATARAAVGGEPEAGPGAPLVSSEPSAPGTGGTVEGIKLHGRWVIEVRDPDGRLAARREFDNALGSEGPRALAEILSRTKSVGFWGIRLSSDTAAYHPCETTDGTPWHCSIAEPGWTSLGFEQETLSVERVKVGGSEYFNAVKLAGHAIVTRDGHITEVHTLLDLCDASVAPSTPCNRSAFADVTKKNLPDPIAVVAGQQVLATVTLSFE